MFLEILTRTPTYVFFIFAALLALGLSQTRTRQVALRRITILALAMAALSLAGTLSAFGGQPLALVTWAAAASAVFALVIRRNNPPGTTFNADTGRLTLPGSWFPLAIMMGIFLTKYIVGVSMAIAPALAQQMPLALGVSALYGVFSGVFLGRGARLWRLANPAISADHKLAV